ncbi:HNH endonuclease [Clostridium nigeriense]|uniref:HNH endonuclease n=1 Tax=Clostridium nigeriense TaxID=1805470 RepID=UPI003D326F0B
MLKSCKYCGRIHDSKYICPSKPIRKTYKKTEEDKFRNTQAWKKKRNYIKDRDKGLCQVCIRKLYNTLKQYNYIDIEVHHITPLREDYELRLDDDNLISLCKYHHELAEKGEIARELLRSMIEE